MHNPQGCDIVGQFNPCIYTMYVRPSVAGASKLRKDPGCSKKLKDRSAKELNTESYQLDRRKIELEKEIEKLEQ